ncbi:hypothetical protein D3C80_2195130 [compost metagenome]
MLKLSSRFNGARAMRSRSGWLPDSSSLYNSFLCTKPSGSSMRPSRINGNREYEECISVVRIASAESARSM